MGRCPIAAPPNFLDDNRGVAGRRAIREIQPYPPAHHIRSNPLRGRVAIHSRDWERVPSEIGQDRHDIPAGTASPGTYRRIGICTHHQIKSDQTDTKSLRLIDDCVSYYVALSLCSAGRGCGYTSPSNQICTRFG